MPMVGHVPCLPFYCQRSATASLLHDTGLSRMAVELALHGYLRTYAVDTEIPVGSAESMIATWHGSSSVPPRTLRLGPVIKWED